MHRVVRQNSKRVIPRCGEVVCARPAMGDQQRQFDVAFAKTFERYEKAFEGLAGR